MKERFVAGKNYVEEKRFPQAENGFDQEAFRLKSFTPFKEYIKQNDPWFYFENAHFIVAPCFYAPSKEQEADKPAKFIRIKNIEDIIPEDIMKEAFCMYEGAFHPNEDDHWLLTQTDLAMFQKNKFIKRPDWAEAQIKINHLYLHKKYYSSMLAQSNNLRTRKSGYSDITEVENPQTGELITRHFDKVNKKDETAINNDKNILYKRKIAIKVALKRYDDRASFVAYNQLKYVKVSPDDESEPDDSEDDEKCSFFEYMVRGFYHGEINALIYRKAQTIPNYQARSLRDLRFRKRKGYSNVKKEFRFVSFFKQKYYSEIDSYVQRIKAAYLHYEFSYIWTAIKIIVNRWFVFASLAPHDIYIGFKGWFNWFVEELKYREEEVEQNIDNSYKKNVKKHKKTLIRIISLKIPKKPLKENIKKFYRKFKKDMNEKYSEWKNRGRKRKK